MGGWIKVESKVGFGTKFTFRIIVNDFTVLNDHKSSSQQEDCTLGIIDDTSPGINIVSL